MKRITAILFLAGFITALFAQAPDTMWTRSFGGSGSDAGYSLQKTIDGGYVITGYTTSFGTGDEDVWLIKTDSNGDSLWSKTFGGSGSDMGNSVDMTSDGGYIITGSTTSFGSRDVWLIKTDCYGDTLWTKTFGGDDPDFGNSVEQTTDGGYVITGFTYSIGFGKSDVWLIKTDSDGSVIWTRTYGGSDWDFGNSVQQTSDGGYIITGLTYSFGKGNSDVWLIKTNSDGDTLWTKTFGDSLYDAGVFIQQTLDGGYIITGNVNGTGRYYHGYAWLIRTNADGDTLWTKTFGGVCVNFCDFSGNSVCQTDDGGYIIAGENIGLIKTDNNGNTLWTGNIEGFRSGKYVQQTSDGGYITTGMGSSDGGGDLWLIKTTPDVTSIDHNQLAIIRDYQLHQNYPNPFNPSTTIEFSLPQSGFVTLKVYNLLGEKVATLVSEKLNLGQHKYNWDADNLASGVYMYQLKAGDFIESRKMILLR